MATTLTAGQMPRLASDGYKEPSILESINPFKHDPTVLSNEVLQKNLIALRTEFDKASKIADDGARVKAMVDVVINAERLAHESAKNMTDSNTAKVLKATTFGLIGVSVGAGVVAAAASVAPAAGLVGAIAAESISLSAHAVGVFSAFGGTASIVSAMTVPYISKAGSIKFRAHSIEDEAVNSLRTIAKSNLPLFKSAFDEATSSFALSNQIHIKTAGDLIFATSMTGAEFSADLYNRAAGPKPSP